ncbi:hypothetical protein ACIHFE_33880 [Streptomyces sp. NPDC052396]|uniref:hypothetical protein n=1 Tax=Streptomyces sp. NPDC052396 TaxID=3365689 RepID=UPI0037CDBC37
MTAHPNPTTAPVWAWPVDLPSYDRRGLLTEAEAEALRNCSIDEIRRHDLAADLPSLRAAARLVRPLADVLAALHLPPDDRHQRRYARDAAGLVLLRSGELRRAFWGWSVQDWADLINADGAEFRRQWGGRSAPTPGRS